MSKVEWHHDYDLFSENLLSADFMVEEMEDRAGRVKARAEATAPVDPNTSEHYKDSFHVTKTAHGGNDGRRAEATVTNDDDAAFVIEVGTARVRADGTVVTTPKHATLGKALDAAKD